MMHGQTKLKFNVVIFIPSCDKNHVADYRITSQMLAHKTEARQRTCAELPRKCWKCLLQKGDHLLYACFSIYTHLIFGGASYGTPVQRRTYLYAN